MARNRLPQAKAEVSGATAKNAGRFEGRKSSKSTRGIGEPYATMDEYERLAWEQVVSEAPWLNSSHRQMLRLACSVIARIEKGDEVGVSAMQMLSSILSKLGMSPADETKVFHPDQDEKDELDEIIG